MTRQPVRSVLRVFAAGAALSGLAAATTPAAALAVPVSGPDDVVLILSGSSVALELGTAVARAEGARKRHDLAGIGAVSVGMPAGSAARVTARLEGSPGLTVRPAHKLTLAGAPNDSAYAGLQQPYLAQVQSQGAWDVTHGSSAVKIAIIDSGVEVSHPDLAGKVVAQYNAVTGTSDVTDDVGHGTSVAGAAAALTNNGVGVAGAGWDSSLMAVKVDDALGDIWLDAAIAGVLWAADHDAQVINISLGAADAHQDEANAIAYAQASGAVVVASAGNESSTTPNYPAAYTNVLAVGATDPDTGHRASFSNHGSWVDVAAPGVGVWATTVNGSYGSADGTSFAAPLVAGAVALLAARSPGATPTQLAQAITGSAQPLPGDDLGAGLLDMSGALDRLPPTTTPTITAPLVGATVTGQQAVTVDSSAALVRLSIDGKAVGVPSDPSTSLSLDTWGFSNGAHVLGAADCTPYACGTPATVGVTVQNDAPTLDAVAAAKAVQPLTARTGAPTVRFTVNGGAPVFVPTSGGSATTRWTTWGVSNGSHPVAVAACSLARACGASAGFSVLVSNTAPAITTPSTSGALVAGTTTFAATSPGGGLRFLVDGVSKGFDGTSPYSLAVNVGGLADGSHTLKVVQCNTAGTACAGPSTSRSFQVRALHPVIVSAVSPFSPNGDNKRDTTTWVLRLPDAETVSYRITTAAGTTVAGPVYVGTRAKGDHSFTWTGRDGSGTRFANGRYTITVSTKAVVGGLTLRGSASRVVRLDTVAPLMSSVVGSGSGFYPYRDGYRDTAKLGVSVNEAAVVNLRITNSSGTLVRSLWTARSSAGALAFTWNGRTSAGAALPAGRYTFRFTARDLAHNRRSSSGYSVAMSWKKLVTKTAVLSKTGSQAYHAAATGEYDDGSPASCADASQVWTTLLLQNYCDDSDPYYATYGAAGAFYGFTLPAAVKYTGMRVDTYGSSFSAPSAVVGAAYNYATGSFDASRVASMGSSDVWTTICYPPVAHHYNSSRVVKVAVLLPQDPYGAADYGIETIRLVVSYQVLQ